MSEWLIEYINANNVEIYRIESPQFISQTENYCYAWCCFCYYSNFRWHFSLVDPICKSHSHERHIYTHSASKGNYIFDITVLLPLLLSNTRSNSELNFITLSTWMVSLHKYAHQWKWYKRRMPNVLAVSTAYRSSIQKFTLFKWFSAFFPPNLRHCLVEFLFIDSINIIILFLVFVFRFLVFCFVLFLLLHSIISHGIAFGWERVSQIEN